MTCRQKAKNNRHSSWSEMQVGRPFGDCHLPSLDAEQSDFTSEVSCCQLKKAVLHSELGRN